MCIRDKLLTPHPKAMTTDAQKRLEAIASLEDLGAGFALATHDLEIRGAGELLGEEQSGSMETIGFSLYMELLENAVDALKAGREPSLEDLTSQQTEVELRMPSLLPDDFIPCLLYTSRHSCLSPPSLRWRRC